MSSLKLRSKLFRQPSVTRIMKYKHTFYWISLILLTEFSQAEDACERDTCLGQLSFGMYLPRSVFTTKYQISPYQCAIECQCRRKRCKSFNYKRSALSCHLCEEDSGPEGINLQPKAGSIHSNIDTWRNIPVGHCNEIMCSWTERCDSSVDNPQKACIKTECQFAELRPGVRIEPSNETAVRTKARYRCMSDDMGRGHFLTTCLESTAEWSLTDFKCVCKSPPAKSGTIIEEVEVEVGQNYTYRCQNGLFGKKDLSPTVTCLQDGSWTLTHFTCVCEAPPTKSGAIHEMVEVEVQQTYTYKCHDGLFRKRDHNPTVTCLQDGNWTSTNFACVCKTPPKKSWTINVTAEVEVEQNYTYKCEDGVFGKGEQNPIITCLHDGNWTSTNFICVKQNWSEDIIYPLNIHKSVNISAKNETDLLACMQACDNHQNCSSFFYYNNTNQCVLSSSFRRGLPDGFRSADGLVYYIAPSASCDMNYKNVSIGNSTWCIKLHENTLRFNEAMTMCESEKAKLLVITTSAQIADSKTLIGQITVNWVFLGMSDEAKENHWVSWTGEDVFPHWNAGEPNDWQGVEDCACVAPLLSGLNDISCDTSIPFLCHKSLW